MTHALPPPTPAGQLPAHSGEIPPLVPTLEAQVSSPSTEGAARIVALEGDINALKGTVNQIAADMAELMALLRASNRTSSNSTPPPGYGPTVDPNPWVPPTHAPEGIEASSMHELTSQPANVPPPLITLSAAIPLPPSDSTTLVPPPMSIPVSAPIYAAPPPMVFPAPSPHALAHTSEPLPFQAPQPHISFSYPALPLLNIPIPEPGTPTQRSKFTILPRRLPFRHRSRSNTPIIMPLLLLRFNKVGPRLRELLSRCNGLWPRRTNRASRHKCGVNSSHPYRLRSPTYTGNSSHEAQAPFVIEYVHAETGVGYAGFDATPAPFVIEVPAREPYQDSKVPWTYEGSVGNLERQFSVMGVKRSGRVYENPEAANKGKAPTAALGIALEATPIPQNKVTEEEAEAFMKIIKASEYKPHREALLKVLTTAQVPKETALDLIVETVGSIFSNNISFSDDELPSEGYAHSRALHIVCKCNNFVVGQVMIDNGLALNVYHVSTLKQMNVDLNRIRPSKMAIRAFDGSRREVNEEIDLLIEKLKFIVEERLITVKGEDDYAIYKETVVPYISIGDDQNLPFHSFDTISIIRDYGKVGPSCADRMVGKILLRHNYIPGSGLGAHGQGINHPIEIEEYKNRKGLSFRPSYHEIIEARICTVTEEIPFGVYVRLAQENEELNNWTSVPRYSAALLESKSSTRRFEPIRRTSRRARSIYFGEGLDEDGLVSEIEESLRRLEDRQLTSVESTEEINVGSEEEPPTSKIGTGLDPEQRARMIDFLKEYQEVFAWSSANMLGLDPSIVKHFLLLDTERFPPKRQHLDGRSCP
ncbi:hypothetical protein CRG98_006705 [Punica granatum]|uniref:G-patch domain-containing protein n=1 Tax=Punica granatum TaxID=22663 RepID=A0A2I0KX13_PUNGR|nr:hypothetical protein CRG98_006705 [Punica granatum]